MGLRDESWCSDCGCSQPYSENDVICGNCTSEAYEKRSVQIINYMKLHLISVEQDQEDVSNEMEKVDMNSKAFNELDFEYNWLAGQIIATRHLLSVASDILGIPTEEK